MSDEKIDAVGEMEWAAELLKDNGYPDSAKDLLAASEAVGNALVTLERLATHVRPTCTELYDEAAAALDRVRST